MKTANFDVLVVGAGPAGLAAAVEAARYSESVAVVDDNPSPGGQIWRGSTSTSQPAEARQLVEQAQASGVTLLSGTRVVGTAGNHRLLVETAAGSLETGYRRLVLATGARELFLPFPGWTLPGVMGAGGLQALVKGGLPLEGKRVVVAGSGPLLLAVASYLRSKGAKIELVAEQAPLTRLAAFAVFLAGFPEKSVQSLELGISLRGVPFKAGCWATHANGDGRLQSVTMQSGTTRRTITCDYLACGFGLVPNTELAISLGCRVKGGRVLTGKWQRTSVEDVYCAGEATGVGGVEMALAEGRIAGLAATGQPVEAERHFPERARARRFAILLERAFAPRDELKSLTEPGTIVCRCEDVSYGQLTEHSSWRSAKLQTRCGMGPCQGRVCGAATGFLFGWAQDSIRPPVSPTRVESLAHAG